MLRQDYPHTNQLLLDANLIVVLIIGQVRQDLFGRSPVSGYNSNDYDILTNIIREYNGSLLTTPYLLAEVSMLLTKTREYSNECRAALSVIIPDITPVYTMPADLAAHTHFAEFGISDISIVDACRNPNVFVLTADGNQSQYLLGDGASALLYKDFKSIYIE